MFVSIDPLAGGIVFSIGLIVGYFSSLITLSMILKDVFKKQKKFLIQVIKADKWYTVNNGKEEQEDKPEEEYIEDEYKNTVKDIQDSLDKMKDSNIEDDYYPEDEKGIDETKEEEQEREFRW